MSELVPIYNYTEKYKLLLQGKPLAAIGGASVGLWLLKKYSDGQLRNENSKNGERGSKKVKAAVNKEFFQRFMKFLPILVPGVATKEFLTLISIGFVLLARTWLDFWMIANNAEVLGSVAKRDRQQFIRTLFKFALMQLPTSFVNNVLKYLISSLALSFRYRLTTYAHKKYMKGLIFYSVSNLDNRLNNVDQLICQDIEHFSTSLSNLYSNVTKPLVDVIVFFYKLVQSFGIEGPSTVLAYFLIAGTIMTRLRTPFGKYTAHQARLEGDFRHVHSRVITYGEEISFYGGNETEHGQIESSFKRLVALIRLNLGFFDSIITKYCATIIAYFIVTAPIFDKKNDARYTPELGGSTRVIMEDYTKYMRLLIAMVTAVGRLIGAGRELSHFAGHTERVSSLTEVLTDLESGNFQRTNQLSEKNGTVKISGSENPLIKFEDVPIITPNGDVLVESMSFKVEGGMNCLIVGPNGCGKSSLFRILGGLWPIYSGIVTRPSSGGTFYVPQRPYLVTGTLRDQVIYPDTYEKWSKKGGTDQQLEELMDVVHLNHVVKREGGWDTVADWIDVLSGGEKQRVAMARLFYHKPLFAILDECTAAVSIDVEAQMYNYCRENNITLFTVSHRPSLWKFHEHLLRFDGNGGYEFRQLLEEDYPK